MSPLGLLVSIVVPALLLLGYGAIKMQSSLLREGLWAGFLAGIGIALALAFWEMALDWLLPLGRLPPIAGAAGHAVLVAALPEEGAKFCVLLLIVRSWIRIGDTRDTILASLGVALGYAAMEDAAYIGRALMQDSVEGTLIAMLRALSAMPEHGICGLTMGALTALAYQGLRVSTPRLIPALLVPLALHAGYDFLLMLRDLAPDQVWTSRMMPMLMAASAVLAILLCNLALQRASDTVRAAGGGVRAPAILGSTLLALGLLLAGAMLVQDDLLTQQVLALYCVVPLLFGLDLLATAFGRVRDGATS